MSSQPRKHVWFARLCLCIKQKLEKIFSLLCFGFELAVFTIAGPFQVKNKLV